MNVRPVVCVDSILCASTPRAPTSVAANLDLNVLAVPALVKHFISSIGIIKDLYKEYVVRVAFQHSVQTITSPFIHSFIYIYVT